MLVLTRKHQEKIRIGDDIVITVLRSKGKSVRLGIEAPATVPVLRGELIFENAAAEVDGHPTDDTTRGAEYAPASGRRDSTRPARPNVAWSTDSAPQAARGPRDTEPQVTLRRLPRNQVAEALPRLVSGAGPLRAMLDNRATSL